MRNIKSYLITDPNYFSDNKEIFKEKLIAVLKNHKIAMEKLTQYLIEKNIIKIKAEE